MAEHVDPRFLSREVRREEWRPKCILPMTHQLLDHAEYMDEAWAKEHERCERLEKALRSIVALEPQPCDDLLMRGIAEDALEGHK